LAKLRVGDDRLKEVNDGCGIPIGKTGGSARHQAPIVEGNGSLQKFLMKKNIPFVMGEDAVYMPRFLIWIKDLSGKSKLHPSVGKKLSKLAQMVIIRMLMSQKKDIDTSKRGDGKKPIIWRSLSIRIRKSQAAG
jgi:hypothetical protein